MFIKNKSFFLVLLIFSFTTGIRVFADNKKSLIHSAFFSYENDSVLGGADRYYSNGVQVFFITKDFYGEENKFFENIFDIKNKHTHNYSFGIGQKIFTPEDIEVVDFLKYDRPYAGYLYLFLNKTIFHDENKYDTVGVNLGATGKMSGSEWTQKEIHKLIGSPEPMGWDYQLNNEVLFMLSWSHIETVNTPIAMDYDWNIIPKLSVNLGTPFTDVRQSLEFRYGWNLQRDLMASKIQNGIAGILEQSNELSYYGFFEVEANFILYNTFLDGNLFRDNKNDIDKKFFVYELMTGMAINYKKFYAKTSAIYISKEFKEQKHNNQLLFSITGGLLFN